MGHARGSSRLERQQKTVPTVGGRKFVEERTGTLKADVAARPKTKKPTMPRRL